MPHPYAEIKLLYAYGQLGAGRANVGAARKCFTASLVICRAPSGHLCA